MNDKLLRDRLNRIRDAMRVITEEINRIYNDNSEEDNFDLNPEFVKNPQNALKEKPKAPFDNNNSNIKLLLDKDYDKSRY